MKGIRQPNFKHAQGIAVAVPYAHEYTPSPTMTGEQVAAARGADLKRRGRPAENPYDANTHPGLYAEWQKGYGA